MKYYKLILGIGALALFNTACSDNDPEYQPAPQVTVPNAYFSLADANVTKDLGETDTEFTLTIYRDNKGAAETVNVVTDLTEAVTGEGGVVTGEGPVASGLFNYPSSVTFAEGEDTANYVVTFNIADLTPNLDYYFKLSVDGESTPYFITSMEATVAYVPWVTLENNMFIDYTSLSISTSPEELDYEIPAQRHPKKAGLYRFAKPFYWGPLSDFYVEPEGDPNNYLYIMVENENLVYFCDSQGKMTYDAQYYYTGINFYNGGGETVIATPYVSLLLDQLFEWGGNKYLNSNWEGLNGQFILTDEQTGAGIINLDKCLLMLLTEYPEPLGFNKKFQIWLDGAELKEWEELGMGKYTDGILAMIYPDEKDLNGVTYDVPIRKHLYEESLYEVVNPYTGGYHPDLTAEQGNYSIIIDCSDPELVMIDLQDILPDESGNISLMNAAAFYTKYSTVKKDKAQLIKEGLNDYIDEKGVIHINHPISVVGGKNTALWNKTGFIPTLVQLPTVQNQEAESAAKVSRAQKNNYTIVRDFIPGRNFIRK